MIDIYISNSQGGKSTHYRFDRTSAQAKRKIHVEKRKNHEHKVNVSAKSKNVAND